MNRFSKQQPSNARRHKTAEQQENITLTFTDSVTVPVALYERIKKEIIWLLPFQHGLKYLVPEDLVGPGLWCELSDKEKNMGRACIAHLSKTGVLPITPRDSALEYTNFYVLV